ncbi:MAG: hypothetical protein EF811_06505 [Methanonatronarchaeia archaeon]|nr:MAG: hypothetical protein EF811_06505 [Methanonatronarchaeia archaeon]
MNKLKFLAGLLAIFTLVLAASTGYFYMATLDQEQEITGLEHELENLTQDYGDLLDDYTQLNQTYHQLEDDHESLLDEYSQLESEYNHLTQEYEELLNDYNFLKEEQAVGLTEYYGLAIRDGDEGTVLGLTTRIVMGPGSIYLDVGTNIFGETTQEASQTSLYVANQHTDLDLMNEYSVLISWETTADIIDGPSASAAETLAIIAAANNQEIDGDVVITGTINTNGEIGPVGGVEEKAIAAMENGHEKILVPSGQYVDIDGIEVVEVDNLNEAKTHVGLN